MQGRQKLAGRGNRGVRLTLAGATDAGGVQRYVMYRKLPPLLALGICWGG